MNFRKSPKNTIGKKNVQHRPKCQDLYPVNNLKTSLNDKFSNKIFFQDGHSAPEKERDLTHVM